MRRYHHIRWILRHHHVFQIPIMVKSKSSYLIWRWIRHQNHSSFAFVLFRYVDAFRLELSLIFLLDHTCAWDLLLYPWAEVKQRWPCLAFMPWGVLAVNRAVMCTVAYSYTTRWCWYIADCLHHTLCQCQRSMLLVTNWLFHPFNKVNRVPYDRICICISFFIVTV